MNRYLFVWFVFVCTMLGCDSSPGPADGTFVSPTSGSTFTYRRVSIDAQGQEIPGTQTFITDSIGDVELSYYGKRRVMQVIPGDTVFRGPVKYYNIEPNGDFSQFFDFGTTFDQAIWVTYPIRSRVGSKMNVLDTVEFSGQTTISEDVTISYEGSDSLIISDRSIGIEKIKLFWELQEKAGSIERVSTATSRLWIAPSLGYIAQEYIEPVVEADKLVRAGMRQTLIRYTIK